MYADQAIIEEVLYDLGVQFIGKYIFAFKIPELQYQKASIYLGNIIGEIRINNKVVSEYIWIRDIDIENLGKLAFNNNLIVNEFLTNKIKYLNT